MVKNVKTYWKTIVELDVLNIYDNKSNSNNIIHPFFSLSGRAYYYMSYIVNHLFF